MGIDPKKVSKLPYCSVEQAWRLHRRGHRAEFYFRGPARFVPAQSDVGVLYLASEELTATAEFISPFRVVIRSDVDKYVLTELAFQPPLQLVDITSSLFPSREIRPLAFSDDYAPSQDFAEMVYKAGFRGIAFPGATGSGKLFAIFGGPGEGKEGHTRNESHVPLDYITKWGVEVLEGPGGDASKAVTK